MLSGSRRLLDGQIPHRDYVSLRPVGTHLLHAHFLLWAGDRLIWWSRSAAWIEWAATAWLWVRIVETRMAPFASSSARWAAAFTAFAATANQFPSMPWNTTDGVLFVTLGVYLHALGRGPAGLLLLGCSSLFRQNFTVVLPAFLLLLGEGRKIRSWILVAFPGALYAAFLLATGAWSDAWSQMSSRGSFLSALLNFRVSPERFACGAVVAFLATSLFGRYPRAAGLLLLAALVATTYRPERSSAGTYYGWFPLGLALGAIPYHVVRDPRAAWTGLLAALLAWTASISEGAPIPDLGSAGTVVWLSMLVSRAVDLPRSAVSALLLLAVFAGVDLHRFRTLSVYYDRPASDLTVGLDGIFPGAKGIRTNERTARFLEERRQAIEVALARKGRILAVPDAPQYWATSAQPNLLSCDWPINGELKHPPVRARVLSDVDAARGRAAAVVSKYKAWEIAYYDSPYVVGEEHFSGSEVRDRIVQGWTKVGETHDYAVYE